MNDEEKRLTFRADDVLMKATMLVGDKVQLNISTNPKTNGERAVNVQFRKGSFRILTEQRKTVSLIHSPQALNMKQVECFHKHKRCFFLFLFFILEGSCKQYIYPMSDTSKTHK